MIFFFFNCGPSVSWQTAGRALYLHTNLTILYNEITQDFHETILQFVIYLYNH